MTFKKIVSTFFALCITATLAVATCGCDDLGAYENNEEYYNSFGNVVMLSKDEDARKRAEYSIEQYFYNKESRENFLTDKNGVYSGIAHDDYVYMAIPFGSNINMDTVALYLESKNDVTVYINVFVTDKIPTAWKSIEGNEIGNNKYDDPDPSTRLGEVAVHLKKEKWDSFVLDTFKVNEMTQNSLEIEDGQFLLIQIRNNSGVRVYDNEKKAYVDPQTGIELERAEITMTNLLIRALNINNDN